MKLTKENYEFQMFELLEGNLDSQKAKEILKEIEADSFYAKEWKLMQCTITSPNEEFLMPDKDSLLKPESNKIILFSLPTILKAAAILTIFGSAIFFYTHNKTTELVNIKPMQEFLIKRNPKSENKIKNKIKDEPIVKVAIVHNKTQKNIKAIQSTDTSVSNYKPLVLQIHSRKPSIEISNIGSTAVNQSSEIELPSPVYVQKSTYHKIINQVKNIQITTAIVWKDLPNLTLKMTPKIKEKKPSIGFELKGNTIYAHAIIQIK